MKKLLFITILAIFLVGCAQERTGPKIGDPFIGGDEGLRIEFVDGAPPDEIYDNGKGKFAVALRMKNIGETYIGPNDGYIELLGIRPQNFDKASQADLKKGFNQPLRESKKNLEGSIIDGGETVVTISDLSYLPDLPGNEQVKLRSDVCYDYHTKSSTKICVKKDLLRAATTRDLCDVSGNKPARNSGSPIHVTSYKQSLLGEGKTQVFFEIEHVGGKDDLFFRRGTNCDPVITSQDIYMVYAKVNSGVIGRAPECSGFEEPDPDKAGGYVRLYEGKKRQIICTIDVSDVVSTYEELFTVDLDYRYYQYIDIPLLIKDIG